MFVHSVVLPGDFNLLIQGIINSGEVCIPGLKSRPVHKYILFGHSSKSLWQLLQLQCETSVVEVIGSDGHANALRASLLHIIKSLDLKRVQKLKWASKVLIKELLLHERH